MLIEIIISTETAFVHLTDQYLENMENGLFTGVVMLDFSAAFDLVDRNLLLAKLKCYNFSDSAVSWICSYLTGRTSTVCRFLFQSNTDRVWCTSR